VSKTNDNAPAELFDKRTFASVCAYLAIMLAGSFIALLGEGTAAAHFAAFDNLYWVVVTLQALFGLFVLPFAVRCDSNARAAVANLTLLFASGMPIVIVGAFSSATLWHKTLLSQMLVLGLWLLAFWLKTVLHGGFRAGCLYVPLAAVLFFGTNLAGNTLAGFSDSGETFARFSVPGVLFSWAEGSYFEANGWLGVAVCFGALVVWSRKLAVSQES
jgi:hypothetical protein